ncbi:MAG TPA: hypothetical protein VMN36_09195 [Verrucomicrobiales bacterium]|nr:hypothetical protein [Verrucomicrobiales bacterium]
MLFVDWLKEVGSVYIVFAWGVVIQLVIVACCWRHSILVPWLWIVLGLIAFPIAWMAAAYALILRATGGRWVSAILGALLLGCGLAVFWTAIPGKIWINSSWKFYMVVYGVAYIVPIGLLIVRLLAGRYQLKGGE